MTSKTTIRTPRRTAFALGTGLALSCASPACALVLIFEPIASNYQPIDQAYGDRATSTSHGGFVYGAEGGFTPNVEVAYGVLPYAAPTLVKNGFGDMKDVLFDDTNSFGHLEVTLTADEGWSVELSRFEMAAWADVDPINAVQVYTETGDMLLNQQDVEVSHLTRTVFSFDPPLVSRTLTVAIDSGNVGYFSDYIAIDNIRFSQVESTVPVETVSWGMLKARHAPLENR